MQSADSKAQAPVSSKKGTGMFEAAGALCPTRLRFADASHGLKVGEVVEGVVDGVEVNASVLVYHCLFITCTQPGLCPGWLTRRLGCLLSFIGRSAQSRRSVISLR